MTAGAETTEQNRSAALSQSCLFLSPPLPLSLALLSSLLHLLGTFAKARRLQARVDLCSCSTPRSQSLSDSSLSAHGGEWGR